MKDEFLRPPVPACERVKESLHPLIPADERVKELPHPLIPADAGSQTLPNCMDIQWGKAWIPASAGMSG